MPEIVSTETAAHIGLVRMQRTDKHNAFNRELDAAVAAALGALDADPDVHAAILTGSGTAFSAGADMNEAVASITGRAQRGHGGDLRGRRIVPQAADRSD
jgi:enoyl-CoA hydratase/carnithine racemase